MTGTALPNIRNIDGNKLTAPQSWLLMLMVRFNDIYGGNSKKISQAIKEYDEESWGPRFAIPCLTAVTGIQPAEHALKFRIWHKSKDPDNPGDSQYHEYASVEEALSGYHDLLSEGYRNVDWPIGVGWDNAIGCFSEFQVQELLDIKKDFPESEDE